MRKLAFVFLALGASGFAESWRIDPAHSAAQFSVRHMMISTVRGDFGGIKGTVEMDGRNFSTARVQAEIDMNALNTREVKRDAHLKSPDFFDVAKYPTMTFQSKRIEASGGKVKMTGDLTIHGVTKEVTFDVEPSDEMKDPRGGARMGASATTKINRQDFGVKWSRPMDGGGVVVGDEVTVTLDIEMVRPAPQSKG